jgi:uncharacterized protein (DUF342 family)
LNIEGIAVSEVGGQIFVRGVPVAHRPPLTRQSFLDLLAHSGYGECVVDDAGIDQAVEDSANKPVPFVILVAQRKDATISIEIAEDAMVAMVSLSPPQGGKPVTIEDVIRALTEAGVNLGVDHDALVAACQAGVADHLVVAHGTPPTEGADSDFLELVPQAADRAPKVNADGLIDYRDHGAIAVVEPGAPLMRRVPPVAGVDGHTVLGQVIASRPVRDEPFASALIGAQVSAQDPDLLIASTAGLPVRVPCGVQVEPVLRVKEVNLATGNIHFDGTVHVEGDIINNMKVQASGDIMVGGTVEAATLEARGNISIKGGVIAASTVVAGGALSARFAEGSSLRCGSVLALDDAALECQLQSANQILIGVKNPQRGRLVGGSTSTKMLLKTPILGSAKSGVTQVTVGADPQLEKRYQELSNRIAAEKANEDNLQKLCQHLIAIKDPKGMLDRAKTSWRQAAQIWGKSLGERMELDKERDVMLSAKLQIGVETDGAVTVTFGVNRMALRKQYGPGTLSIDREAKIVFTGPDGKAYPAV